MDTSADVYSEFRSGSLRIATRLEPVTGAERLTVVLNGYCDRITCEPPAFVHWPEASPVFGTILRISDPSLLLSDWLKGGCFLGTEADDPVPAIVSHCREIACDLGIAPANIAYIGNSGAGFGALQCAILDGVSIAVVTNALMELAVFSKFNFGNEAADIFRPNAALADLCIEYPERFSVIAAMKRAAADGKRPRLGLIQNVSDISHFDVHYAEFCRTFAVPVDGGSNPAGTLHAEIYDSPEGHASTPSAVMIEHMVDRCLASGG